MVASTIIGGCFEENLEDLEIILSHYSDLNLKYGFSNQSQVEHLLFAVMKKKSSAPPLLLCSFT
jgi:hypothetical protein